MMVQNGIVSPAVLDTDGNLRWVAAGPGNSMSSLFDGDGFFVGSATTAELFRLEFNGAYGARPLASTRYTNFHHDLTPGKTGLLAELDGVEGGIPKVESILAEISRTGEVIKEWDMAAIFRAAMQAGGDGPSNFVRDGIDWFHMNSAIYVAADDSLLISSRENFVVKIDYATGRIKWLLGDTTKYWYVDYPSLRALALELKSGKPPIGQLLVDYLERRTAPLQQRRRKRVSAARYGARHHPRFQHPVAVRDQRQSPNGRRDLDLVANVADRVRVLLERLRGSHRQPLSRQLLACGGRHTQPARRTGQCRRGRVRLCLSGQLVHGRFLQQVDRLLRPDATVGAVAAAPAAGSGSACRRGCPVRRR
jgi:hypothetical protein